MLRRSLVALCAVMTTAFASACAAPAAADGAPPAANAAATSAATLASGKVRRWPEATAHLLVRFDESGPRVELGRSEPSGLDAFWSIASTADGGSGYFYADVFRARGETRVAHATARRVSEIRDAAALDWTTESVGPVPASGIVVMQHTPSRRYLALVLDAIEPTDPRTAGAGPYAYADVTWYLTREGSADFSGAQ
jgi:hypothetical protein